ncbi:MAG: hypothetical protein Q9160_009161 [Pyrenula sp. 1 TL-2023]
MNPYASWAIVLALIGVSTWYYKGRPNVIAKLIPSDPKPVQDESRSSTKARKKPKVKKETSSDDNKMNGEASVKDSSRRSLAEATNKRKDVNVQPVTDSKSIPKNQPPTAKKDEPDGDDNNKAFADRMSKVRVGTSLKAPEKAAQATRDVRAQKEAPSHNLSASPVTSTGPSSSTGGDADDDMSPATSPALGASKENPAQSGDISDMLENGPAGPSVLRLTGDVDVKPKKKPTDTPFQAAETKKQRQARLKRERQKQEIAEAEKQRKALMEQQLRGARQAVGTSNQTKANSFNATSNPWSQGSTLKKADQHVENNAQRVALLLDTFDAVDQKAPVKQSEQISQPEAAEVEKQSVALAGSRQNGENNVQTVQNNLRPVPAAGAAGARTGITPLKRDISPNKKPLQTANSGDHTASSEGKLSWADDFPSEEEQMRILQDTNEDDAWNTVTSRKDKKKLAKGREVDEYSSVNTGGFETLGAHSQKSNGIKAPKAATTGAKVSNRGNGFASLEIPTSGNGFHDSEWEA